MNNVAWWMRALVWGRRGAAAGTMVLGLWGCAHVPAEDAAVDAPGAAAPAAAYAQAGFEGWRHSPLPGKTPSEFAVVQLDGRDAVQARANASASLLRKQLRIEPEALGHVRFSWRVPELLAEADMARRETDDASVRVVLAFDGDRSRFSPKNAMLSELSRTLTGEEMPYATLMYTWCNRRPAGSVVLNPRTDRIRTLVVEAGSARLNQWLDYERDIAADYQKVFGEPPGALIALAIMTDTDNTRSQTTAWYGPLQLLPALLSKQ